MTTEKRTELTEIGQNSPDRKRKTPPHPWENKQNDVYLHYARGFQYAKWITLGLLISFIIGMLIAFPAQITPGNLQYMLRQFQINTTIYSHNGNQKNIAYQADRAAAYASFQGNFVLAGQTGVTVYDLGGSTVMSYDHTMTKPMIAAAAESFLVYDLGGTTYGVYNAYTQKSSGSCEKGIALGAMSDSGVYAIVTRSAEYRGVLRVYSPLHTNIANVYKDKFIMDVQIRSDGSEILVVSVGDLDGDYNAEVMIFRPSEQSAKLTLNLGSVLPVQAQWHEDGSFTVVCHDALRFYDAEGNLISSYPFGEHTPLSCTVEGDLTVIAFNRNVVGNENDILVFGPDGAQLWQGNVYGHLLRMIRRERILYVLTSNEVTRVDLQSGLRGSCAVEKNAQNILLNQSGDTLLVCYSTKLIPYLIASSFSA